MDRYFLIGENSEEIEIVAIDKLLRKCIEIAVDSEIYLTYCVGSEEYDWNFRNKIIHELFGIFFCFCFLILTYLKQNWKKR